MEEFDITERGYKNEGKTWVDGIILFIIVINIINLIFKLTEYFIQILS